MPPAACEDVRMPLGRADRRRQREPRVKAVFKDRHVHAALDLLELLELAWHDCYRDISPRRRSSTTCSCFSEGSLDKLLAAAKLAVTDWRDLKVSAAEIRASA